MRKKHKRVLVVSETNIYVYQQVCWILFQAMKDHCEKNNTTVDEFSISTCFHKKKDAIKITWVTHDEIDKQPLD